MPREALKGALRAFGISQAELARAAGLSEAAVSRQLSGGLRLTQHVEDTAGRLIVQRGAQVAARMVEWVEVGRFAARKRDTSTE